MLERVREIAEILKVLGNENRLSIVCLLIEKPMTVSELHDRLGHITQPALSQHLNMLKMYKILDSNKSGLTITYFIKDERIINVLEAIKANYCD